MSKTMRRLERSAGALATQSVSKMDELLPWFRSMPPDRRSWVTLVAQAGVSALVEWMRDPDVPPRLTGEVFGTAPRELARAVSLKQTVDLIRVVVGVVESRIESLAEPGTETQLREGILRYSREVAFAAAQIYASYAESRGAWDARLEALVVDSVLRAEADETTRSRASALGWEAAGDVTVVLGRVPSTDPSGPARESLFDDVRRSARQLGLDALCAVQSDRLVVILGNVDDPDKAGAAVAHHFGDGPVVIGPVVADLVRANVSARAAVAGLRAAPGWPEAPRPVTSDDLLPERALSGDGHARRALVQEIYLPLLKAADPTLDTVSTYLDHGGSIEGTARAMFVHANTIRYRLRRSAEITGLSVSDPRQSYVYRVALTLGRLNHPDSTSSL